MIRPTVSVVSLTWNSSRFVGPMVETLMADAAHSGVPIELIIIDNGSRDDTPLLIRELQNRYDNIQFVALSKNFGTTVSRNIGIRMARGEYIFILDSDTEMPTGTLRGLVESTARLPDPQSAGIICPKLIYPDGGFQESARRFPTVQTKVYRLFGLEGLRAEDESLRAVLEQKVTPVDYAISAAWFVPRTTFDRIGHLDEEIFYSPEDVEFCARVWSHGLRVWYYPEVKVIHNCQRLTNKRPISKLGLSHAKGLVRYWWTYGSFFTRPSVMGPTHQVEVARANEAAPSPPPVKQAAE